MMRRMLRVPAVVVAASFALLAAGCGAGGNSGTAGVPALQKVGNLEKTSLNVAVLANTDSAGFFVALHEGLFADEGLQVHYTPAYSDNIIAAQAKGTYDITGMNYVSYIQAQVHKVANLHIFAEGSVLQQGTDVIMVMPHAKTQSLTALKGHVLGVNTTVNIGYLLVASLLSENGLTMKITPGYSTSAVMLPGDPHFPFPASQPLVDGKVAAAVMSNRSRPNWHSSTARPSSPTRTRGPPANSRSWATRRRRPGRRPTRTRSRRSTSRLRRVSGSRTPTGRRSRMRMSPCRRAKGVSTGSPPR